MPSHDEARRRYDVVVIGAGPAGEAAAELGGSLGYSVALVERDTVGGTVITSGGAPTKTFREAAVYLSSFEKEKIYGIALSAPPEVMYPAVRARARQVSEQLQQATLEARRWPRSPPTRGVRPCAGRSAWISPRTSTRSRPRRSTGSSLLPARAEARKTARPRGSRMRPGAASWAPPRAG